MTTHIGIYFPSLHLPPDRWLKVTALYWDKIYRIIPRSLRISKDKDSRTARELEGHGFIGSVHPEDFPEDLYALKIEFVKLILAHEDELVKHYGVENRSPWLGDDLSLLEWAALKESIRLKENIRPRLQPVHFDKLDYELQRMLAYRGLASIGDESGPNSGWLGMHHKLSDVYMAALAEVISVRAQASPLTDKAINYFAMGGFTFERLAQVLLKDARIATGTLAEEELEAGLASIATTAVMPRNISAVPVKKIIALRERYAGQLASFQKLVEQTISELPSLKLVEGQQFVHDHLEVQYKKTIKPKLDELDDSMKSIGIDTIPTIINMDINVPSMLLAGGLLAGAASGHPILGATAAVALGLSKVIADKRKAIRDKINQSDVAYLMNLRDDLTPAGSLQRLNRQSRKLILGV